MANIYDMADTWNDAGTTFTAIKMTVTESAAASGSLLLDLQHGVSGSEASKFTVDNSGIASASGLAPVSGSTMSLAANMAFTGASQLGFDFNIYTGATAAGSSRALMGNGFRVGSSYNYAFSSTSAADGVPDLYLSRKGTRNLQLGPADAAALQDNAGQTLSVQSIANGTTLDAVGGDFTIQGSAGTGSGAGGSIIFQVAPAGGSGTGQNTPVDAFRITSARNFEFIGAAPSKLTFVGESIIARNTANTADRALLSQYGIRAGSNVHIGFSDSTTSLSSMDTLLWRDAANTLALRNGTNAQEFRVYKTETSTVYKALLGDNNLIKISGEAFTDGAGSDTGTLTNAPAAGNPTKWIPIDDNGTTRYIPAW